MNLALTKVLSKFHIPARREMKLLSGPVRVNQAVGEEHFDEKIFNFQF